MTATIAITVGDPAGVGPEIALKAGRHFAPQLGTGAFRLRLIGSLAALGEVARSLDLPFPPLAQADEPRGLGGFGNYGGV